MIRKVYEVDPLLCPRFGGQMRIISFIKEPKIIDRIIGHLKLTFEAARPPPLHNVQQELLYLYGAGPYEVVVSSGVRLKNGLNIDLKQ